MSVGVSNQGRFPNMPIVFGNSTRERLKYYRNHVLQPSIQTGMPLAPYRLSPSPLRKIEGPMLFCPKPATAPVCVPHKVVDRTVAWKLKDEIPFIMDKIKQVDTLLKREIDYEEYKKAKEILSDEEIYTKLKLIANRLGFPLSCDWNPDTVRISYGYFWAELSALSDVLQGKKQAI